jgi:hypothetical protein
MHQVTNLMYCCLLALSLMSNAMALDLPLLQAVLAGADQAEAKKRLGLVIVDAGELRTPSKRLTVVDPGWMFPAKLTAINTLAPASKADVKLAKITRGENRGMPAFLILAYADIQRFKSAELVTWAKLPNGEKNGYVSIDSGEIAVIDTAVIPTQDESASLAFGESVIQLADVEKSVVIDPVNAVFVVAKSGNGDGAYPCYWLKDANGEIVALLVDFENWTSSQNPK